MQEVYCGNESYRSNEYGKRQAYTDTQQRRVSAINERITGMSEVIIALGSNTNAHATIEQAIFELKSIVNNIQPTRLYDNESVDFMYNCTFTNALVKGTTTLNQKDLEETFKAIENKLGRTKENDSKGYITIDIDLLEYDGCKLRDKDWEREYIKQLASELQ